MLVFRGSLNNSFDNKWTEIDFAWLFQGFVCPICMISLQSAEGLQQHFEDAHDENKQNQGVKFICCRLIANKIIYW